MHPVLALFGHNAWATSRLLNWCRWQQAAAAAPDVYGDIPAMFNHILAAENRYLRLLTGEMPGDAAGERAPKSLSDLEEPARLLARRWEAVLASDREIDAPRVHERRNEKLEMPDWLPLAQAVHHGDDHRTQICTLLGRANVIHPEIDGWYFGFEPASAPPPPAWADALLRRSVGHHLWATKQLLDRCRALSRAELELASAGTYGSILATLSHLVSADRGHLSRLKRMGRVAPLEETTVEELSELWERQLAEWPPYLDSRPDYEATVEASDGWYPGWILVLQAIHHGNDHRTNVGTVMLGHDLELPDLDVWAYAEAEGVFKTLATG